MVSVLDRLRLGSIAVPMEGGHPQSSEGQQLVSTAVPRQYSGDLAAFLRLRPSSGSGSPCDSNPTAYASSLVFSL